MPNIYLSPSTQDWNPYPSGGNEEYYMNLIADAMEPYLVSSGIQFTRNTPEMTAASSIAQSNEGNYDLHLALHSNASPPQLSGRLQGTDVYYSPNSVQGKRAAEIIAKNLKDVYPRPELVKAVPTTSLGEVYRTRAPGVLIEFAYHDNLEDEQFIKDNIENLARNVVFSLTEYFGIPFVLPQEPQTGIVTLGYGSLNIRAKPSTSAPVLTQAYNGQRLTIVGTWQDWYVVHFNGTAGYANAAYIQLAP